MRELLFRAYITRTIYVEEDGYVDVEKEVRFHLDGVAIYTDGHIGISWDDFYHNLHSQGFSDDEIEKAFDAYDDHWDEWALFVPDAIAQYTGKVDSFGNKIFDGDLVKYTRTHWSSYSEPTPHDLVFVGTIEWSEEDCSYKFKHPTGEMSLSFKDSRAKENIIERIGSKYVKEETNDQ